MNTLKGNWNRKLETLLHIIIWLSILLAVCLIFSQFMPWQNSALRGFFNVLPIAILFYFILWMVNHYWEKKKFGQFSLLAFTLVAIGTIIRGESNKYFPLALEEYQFFENRKSWYLAALITNLACVGIGILYQLVYNRYEAEKRNLSIINEQREAQLQALRGQINPHFLFNTLNNIYALAVVDSKPTADMVLKLSKLLRYVIYDSQEKKVTLKKEVQQIEEFIELFQMRMEEPANIQFDFSGVNDHQLVEPMILIPFLENGFKHGDFDTNVDAFLKADLGVKNDQLDFKIVNSKNNLDTQKDRRGGVGLDNIKKRLELKYSRQYQLDIHDQEDQFFVHFKLQLAHDEN